MRDERPVVECDHGGLRHSSGSDGANKREERPTADLPWPVQTQSCAHNRLLQIVAELFGAGGVAELAQRLGLDLADALSGDVELAADLFEGAAAAVL